MNDDPRLRLFVSVSVPRELLDWLHEETTPLRTKWTGARWTSTENQHITLKFLGSTPSDRLDPIMKVLGIVAAGRSPAEVSLGELGAFPTVTRMRVLWVGLHDPDALLTSLAGDVGTALEPLGYPVEVREFRPHLTLARWREPLRRKGALPPLETGAMPSFSVTSFELFRSHLHPKGARYEVLESFSLKGERSN